MGSIQVAAHGCRSLLQAEQASRQYRQSNLCGFLEALWIFKLILIKWANISNLLPGILRTNMGFLTNKFTSLEAPICIQSSELMSALLSLLFALGGFLDV